MGEIFSPGKLLLTSEYAVLDGALALAVATKPGQEFFFEEVTDKKSEIYWTAKHQGKIWLSATINYARWEVVEANDVSAAKFVLKMMQASASLSAERFADNSYKIVTNLQFPADFGLGSSSTLINNVAAWCGADPFLLNDLCFGGSGYDIAVARAGSSVIYQIEGGERKFKKINYAPDFKDELIFVHLNKKQNSREGIAAYRTKEKSPALVADLTQITQKVIAEANLERFSELMICHEETLSEFLKIETVKQQYFRDCPVFVKSLGAWGGDFVMTRKFEGYKQYFREKNFNTFFGWGDLIL